MAYEPFEPQKHHPVTLQHISYEISSAVIEKLKAISHPFEKAHLQKHGVVQAIYKDIPVLGIPMTTGHWHCINYWNYPADPRFFNASKDDKNKIKLGLIGPSTFDVDVIFLTEGVWDFLTLRQYAFNAWGLPGVNNFMEEWLELLKGKTVYILFDNDEPGRKYAKEHATRICRVAEEVRILNLPTALNGQPVKDISDLFNIDPLQAQSILSDLITKTPSYKPNTIEALQEIVLGKGNSIGKGHLAMKLVLEDLEAQGGTVIPYNNFQEMALIVNGADILTDEKIDVLLSRDYNYLPSDPMWKYVKEMLYTHAVKKTDVLVDIYATNREDSVYLGLKKQGLLKIGPGTVELGPQGMDNVYVKASSDLRLDLEVLDEIPSDPLCTIDGVLNLFHYTDRADQQKFLLKAWFFQTFFSPTMKPILAIYGEPGGGKTLLMKLLKGILFGFGGGRPNPNTMPEEDYSFTLILKEYKYFFLDEVNESNAQMKQKLRVLATGEESIFRPKYGKKNVRFRPQMWLAIAAHTPKFRDIDIAQRLCITRLSKPQDGRKLVKEEQFLREMGQRRPMVWLDIIRTLRGILTNLKGDRSHIPLSNYCRQIELAEFAWRAFPEERELCLETFNNMHMSQNQFSTEMDPLMDLIEQELAEKKPFAKDGKVILTVKQLHQDLYAIAKAQGIKSFPASTRGLAQWLGNRSTILVERFGFERVKNAVTNSFDYSFTVDNIQEEF